MPLIERRVPEDHEMTDFEKFLRGAKTVLPTAEDRKTFYIKFGALGLFMVVVFGAVIAMLLGVGRAAPAPTHTLNGSVVIASAANFTTTGSTCAGTGDAALLANGGYVNIAMPNRSPIGATLGAGSVQADGSCSLPFSVKLPQADSYAFSIGALAPITKAAADLSGSATGDTWTVSLSW